jgi:hypothetical protein
MKAPWFMQPSAMELSFFLDWLKKNQVSGYDPLDWKAKLPDYDYLNAFRAGAGRESGHFVDKFKFPWHSTFSDESIYYKPGMPAVHWLPGNKMEPAGRF